MKMRRNEKKNNTNPDEKNEHLRKILQYFMLVLLLTAAFVLPKYGVMQRKMGKETRNKNHISMQSAAEKNKSQKNNEIKEENNTQDNKDKKKIDTNMDARKGTIVLDPGHGGFDGGMIGNSGISEKVLNLIYAQKLAVLLEQEGYQVILTRTTEAGLYDAHTEHKKAQDMQRRCAIIEAEQPLLTVSIHLNSYPQDSSVRGPQVFYYEHSSEGEKLAACIQNKMNEQLQIERPRMQKANGSYYILKRSASTTVLVEVGFLTNPQEELLLQQEEYQDRAVRAICDGILEYSRMESEINLV